MCLYTVRSLELSANSPAKQWGMPSLNEAFHTINDSPKSFPVFIRC